jgi:F-type H+-transporting ATPase subunit b
MNLILRQLAGLLVGSLPTMVIFLLLIPCYVFLMHRPLKRTLAERRERTAGAVEKAHTAVALAEAKSQEYEARLRGARVEIQQAREKQIAGWNTARDRALAEAREVAGAQVRKARQGIAAEAEQSRKSMDGAIDGLADQILRAVTGVSVGIAAGEARS